MEFPRRSLLERVAAELCILSQDINRNTVPVDVASLLEVNNVNIVLCDCIHVIAVIICLYLLLHECFYKY